MNKAKVPVMIVGIVVFLVSIRILFNPRPVVYILTFPYGFIAGSVISSRLWLRLRTRLRLEKRTPLPETAEMQ